MLEIICTYVRQGDISVVHLQSCYCCKTTMAQLLISVPHPSPHHQNPSAIELELQATLQAINWKVN